MINPISPALPSLGCVLADSPPAKLTRRAKAALDGEYFHRRRASAQRRLAQRHDLKVRAGAYSPQEVDRGEQGTAGCLAVLLEPRRHVHGVAEIGNLPAGIAAFADDHRAGMQGGAKPRDPAELALIGVRAFLDPVFDGEEAVQAPSP